MSLVSENRVGHQVNRFGNDVELVVVTNLTPSVGPAVGNVVTCPYGPTGPLFGVDSEYSLHFGGELVVQTLKARIQHYVASHP